MQKRPQNTSKKGQKHPKKGSNRPLAPKNTPNRPNTRFWDTYLGHDISDSVLRGTSPKVTINQLKIDPLFQPLKKPLKNPDFQEYGFLRPFFQRWKKRVNFQLIYSNFWTGTSQNPIRKYQVPKRSVKMTISCVPHGKWPQNRPFLTPKNAVFDHFAILPI